MSHKMFLKCHFIHHHNVTDIGSHLFSFHDIAGYTGYAAMEGLLHLVTWFQPVWCGPRASDKREINNDESNYCLVLMLFVAF